MELDQNTALQQEAAKHNVIAPFLYYKGQQSY
jgi:hypothetical protein